MRFLYWTLAAIVAWCYVGYPLFTAVQARVWARPVRHRPLSAPAPRVTVVLAVRNAERWLARRLENLLMQDYPAEDLSIVVVSNGSVDGTEAVARRFAGESPRVRLLVSPPEGGKVGALNLGVAAASSELIVFADARQLFHPGAVRRLVAPFGDPEVGAVTGRLVVTRADRPAVEGVRWYWEMESRLRAAESRSGSLVGATGAIYAIRRSAFVPFPPGLILDDVYQPMRVAMRGHRVVMAQDAIAYDEAADEPRAEYGRKRRTMVGNIQLLTALPGLLSPTRNPLFLRFLSHKLLRLFTPLCFLGMLGLSGALPGTLYRGAFLLEATVYVLGLVGLVVPLRLLSLPSAFVLVQAAILSALYRWRQDAADVWISATGVPAPPPA